MEPMLKTNCDIVTYSIVTFLINLQAISLCPFTGWATFDPAESLIFPGHNKLCPYASVYTP